MCKYIGNSIQKSHLCESTHRNNKTLLPMMYMYMNLLGGRGNVIHMLSVYMCKHLNYSIIGVVKIHKRSKWP